MAFTFARDYEKWISSDSGKVDYPIQGAFIIPVQNTLMTSQTIEFMFLKNQQFLDNYKADPQLLPFFCGQHWYSNQEIKNGDLKLIWLKPFDNIELFNNFDIYTLLESINKLEIILDHSFLFSDITYCVDIGTGLNKQLLAFHKKNFSVGKAFECEDRSSVLNTSLNTNQITSRESIAMQLYIVGNGIISLGDIYIGLLESAFMHFYQCCELLIGTHKDSQIETRVNELQVSLEDRERISKITRHVFIARNWFFAHSGYEQKSFYKEDKMLIQNSKFSSQVIRQVLVAKWLSRYLLSIVLKTELKQREFRIYDSTGIESYNFNGNISDLSSTFKIPE